MVFYVLEVNIFFLLNLKFGIHYNMFYYLQNKLNVFLAPFLHGMRYTSYGRHFTKLDKLQLVGATISP